MMKMAAPAQFVLCSVSRSSATPPPPFALSPARPSIRFFPSSKCLPSRSSAAAALPVLSFLRQNCDLFPGRNADEDPNWLHKLLLTTCTSLALSLSLFILDVDPASAFVVTSPRKLQSDELATVQLFQENTPSVVYITNLAVKWVFELDKSGWSLIY